MRKWRKNEIKTGPLQRMFSSNMPLLWYCYAIVACSTKRGALEENIQLAVGAGAARYWGGGLFCIETVPKEGHWRISSNYRAAR